MLTSYLSIASKLCLSLLVGSAAAQSFPITVIVPSAADLALAASQERLFSYGRSPRVANSPQTSGDGKWEYAYHEARKLVDEMTNDEKNNLTYGHV
jgi:beta-glucosidase